MSIEKENPARPDGASKQPTTAAHHHTGLLNYTGDQRHNANDEKPLSAPISVLPAHGLAHHGHDRNDTKDRNRVSVISVNSVDKASE